jgi:acyl-CoA synthetase (AMP-forming)/AMP-acid ligase II
MGRIAMTLDRVLRARAAEHPDRTFVSFPDARRSYGELLERSTALAQGLVAAGLRPGGHVAVLLPNSLTFIEVLFGVHLAGGVLVPINARFKRRELAYILEHSDVEILVTTDLIDEYTDFTGLVAQALPSLQAGEVQHLPEAPRLRRIYLDGSKSVPFAQPLSTLRGSGALPDARAPQDTAVLLYTSGTTANPKGCELTHEALIRSWSAYADLAGLEPEEAVWTPCPFFHVGGIGITVASLVRGATMLSMTYFQPEVALRHIREHRAQHLFPAFPPLTLGILRSPQYDPAQFTHVRTVLNVSPAETQTMIQGLLPDGTVLLTDFGMTEGSGLITATARDSADEERLGRNGTPLPGIEVRITGEDGISLLPPDTPGEIQFRGINAFRRYYKDPAATAATILDGGWVRTGDLGSLDEHGSLLFLGRIKDVLKVGGENVTPLEVESHLSTHPAVKMAQVVGRASDRLGEEPVAFVELAGECTEEELIAFCRGQLASYKVPREVRFVTEWPMSATKIQKFRLRELLSEDEPLVDDPRVLHQPGE